MVLIIFLVVKSAFNIKKSSRFIYCFATKNSFTIGLLNDQSINTQNDLGKDPKSLYLQLIF